MSSYYYPRHHRAYSGNLSTYSPHTPTSSFALTNRNTLLASHYNTSTSRPQSMYNNYLPNQSSHLSYQHHSPSYRQYSPTRELKNKVFSPCDSTDDLSFSSPSNSSYLLNSSTSSYNDNNNDINASSLSSLSQSQSQSTFTPYNSVVPKNKKTLILDLDETLVHSSFKPFYSKPDIHLNIKFDNEYHNVYVLKRPYVDEFLSTMSMYYNIIIFTASIKEYANPLLDKLDKHKCIQQRLFRGDCKEQDGLFIKDLSVIRQHLKDLIIVDNNPVSYSVNVDNGIPIKTWHYDKRDCELERLVPLLKYLVNVDDVRSVIRRVVRYNEVDFDNVKMIIQNDRGDNDRNNNNDNDNNNSNSIMNRSRSLEGLQRVSSYNSNKMVNSYSYLNNNNSSSNHKQHLNDEEDDNVNNNKSHCELNARLSSAQSGNYTYRHSHSNSINGIRTNNNNNYYSISHSPTSSPVNHYNNNNNNNNHQTINYNNRDNHITNYIENRQHNVYPQTTRYSSNSKNNTYYNSFSPMRIQLEETKQNSQLNIHNHCNSTITSKHNYYHNNHNMLNVNSPNNHKRNNLFTPNTTSSSSAFSKETNYYIKRKMMNRQLSSNMQNTLIKNKNIVSNFSNISYIQPPNTPEWRMMSKRPMYSNQYLPFRYNN